MKKTKLFKNVKSVDKISIDTTELQALLGCGRKTAVDIGIEAQARITMGKRVLWNVDKIQQYLDRIAE